MRRGEAKTLSVSASVPAGKAQELKAIAAERGQNVSQLLRPVVLRFLRRAKRTAVKA